MTVYLNIDVGNIPMLVNEAAMSSGFSIDPRLQWAARGVSGHDADPESEELVRKNLANAASQLKAGVFPEKFKRIMMRSKELFKHISSSSNVAISPLDRKFIFVIGAPRTGGVFLLTEIYRAMGVDPFDLDCQMLLDYIPHSGLLGVDDVYHPLMATFELCQFLAWAEEHVPKSCPVVKKRLNYAFSLRQLNALFGDAAKYIITIRHPLPSVASFVERTHDVDFKESLENDGRLSRHNSDGQYAMVRREMPMTKDKWDRMTVFEQYLEFWKAVYISIGNTSHVCREVIPLLYGDQYGSFLRSLNPNFDPMPIKSTKRDEFSVLESFPKLSDRVEEAVETVRSVWASNGLRFPEFAEGGADAGGLVR